MKSIDCSVTNTDFGRRSFFGIALSTMANLQAWAAPDGGRKAIKVGQSIALVGEEGERSRHIVAGANMAFEVANKTGGVHGRSLQLITLDDGSAPERTLLNCERLVREIKADVLFGISGSANNLAVEQLLRSTGVPLFGAFAISDSVRARCDGAAYYVRAGYRQEAAQIAQEMAKRGVRRVALAYLGNGGGEEVRALMLREIRVEGLELVGSAAVQPDGSNLSHCISGIAAAMPQAIVLFLPGVLPSMLISGLETRLAFPAYYGFSLVPGESTADALQFRRQSLNLARVMPDPWDKADPETMQYRALARAAGLAIGYASFEGFVTALALTEVLRKAAPDLSPKALHSSMESFHAQVAGLAIDFGLESNTGSKVVQIVRPSSKWRL